jgi:hypothetical protein
MLFQGGMVISFNHNNLHVRSYQENSDLEQDSSCLASDDELMNE